MSKGPIREDKTCLNCGARVEDRFCPECGQENTETRKSFHYLFTHFVEDLVHYDSGFWKTLKYLLFFPAKLTREYLSGRRKQFVAPVKLYIFISFVTFFISGFFMVTPKEQSKEDEKEPFIKMTSSANKPNLAVTQVADTVITAKDTTINQNLLKSNKYGWFNNYKSVAQYDSIQKALPQEEKASKLQNLVARKLIEISEHNTPKQALVKFLQVFKQNIPKVLFLYMPLFAFSLWLFHGKKRWLYFDHGIFTLHYFAFLLLITSLFILSEEILDFGNSTFTDILLGLIRTAYVWPIIYFYKAHRRLYGESGFVSFMKGSVVLFVNFILMVFVLSCAMIYTLMGIS